MGAGGSAGIGAGVGLTVCGSDACLHLIQLQSFSMLRQAPECFLTCTCQAPWPLPC